MALSNSDSRQIILPSREIPSAESGKGARCVQGKAGRELRTTPQLQHYQPPPTQTRAIYSRLSRRVVTILRLIPVHGSCEVAVGGQSVDDPMAESDRGARAHFRSVFICCVWSPWTYQYHRI